MASSLILVANPGSSSRKYAVFSDTELVLSLHFERLEGQITATAQQRGESQTIPVEMTDLSEVPAVLTEIISRVSPELRGSDFSAIGVRVVAPSSYFLDDRIVTDELVARLGDLKLVAPIHVSACLEEITKFREEYPNVQLCAISDSAFHSSKPPYAWNYGISLRDADEHDIKRFGYHGISVSGVVEALVERSTLPERLVVCHLGSGASISAVFHGKSVDTTMGFSPTGGILMATRSGDVDPTALIALKNARGFTDEELLKYINYESGLLGLSGSADMRDVIARQAEGDHIAHLSMMTYIHAIQKGIGQMIAVMNGIDGLVFTGTIGERSSIIRRKVVSHLQYVDFCIDGSRNDMLQAPTGVELISLDGVSRPIFVIPTNEARVIYQKVLKLCS